MSISLKNHEDRIVELEFNKNNSSMLIPDFTTFEMYENSVRKVVIDKKGFIVGAITSAKIAHESVGITINGKRFGYSGTYGADIVIEPWIFLVIPGDIIEWKTTIQDVSSGLGLGFCLPKAILYSFSYIIIYRLTQILFSSHLFGDLFSRKGGARTI